jgi:16S rRNA (cytosine967-C5)-methyltransferase
VRKKPFEFVRLSRPQADQNLYIQNITPALLCMRLSEKMTEVPCRILDLCASPGGKLLMAHDLFPQAELYANDVSEDKMRKVRENLKKYDVTAHLTIGIGEKYPTSQRFDLIILDVPCSNTGVLNKRPEARFRLNREYLDPLKAAQLRLLKHARELISEKGFIWYMTCSILPEENEQIVDCACELYGLKMISCCLQLPNREGYDGGYAALLQPVSKNF